MRMPRAANRSIFSQGHSGIETERAGGLNDKLRFERTIHGEASPKAQVFSALSVTTSRRKVHDTELGYSPLPLLTHFPSRAEFKLQCPSVHGLPFDDGL